MLMEDLLAPVTAEVYLNRILGIEARLFPGESGRFERLLSWNCLNDLLRHHRVDAGPISLAKNHQAVPPNAYNPEIPTFPEPGSTVRHRRVEALGLNRHLRLGATPTDDREPS